METKQEGRVEYPFNFLSHSGSSIAAKLVVSEILVNSIFLQSLNFLRIVNERKSFEIEQVLSPGLQHALVLTVVTNASILLTASCCWFRKHTS